MAGLKGGKGASYAWVVLAVLFIGHAMGFGIRASFGAYVSPWEQEFLAGRSAVSSISMLSFFVFCVGQLLAGRLNDRFGKGIVPAAGVFLMGASLILTSQADQIWKVVILFGVGFSMGFAACSNSVPSAIIANWFAQKRGFALGLVMSGFAVGQLVLVPASLYFVGKVGWRGTMAALGIILIVAIGPLFVAFLRSKPEEKGLKPYGYAEPESSGQLAGIVRSEDRSRPADNAKPEGVGRPAGNAKPEGAEPEGEKPLPAFGVFRLRAFWQLAIPYFICGFTDVGIIQTHLIPFAEGKGLSVSLVAAAFILIAAANIAGTIVTGHLSDHTSRTRQLAIIYAFRAVTYIILIALHQPWLLLLFAVLYGVVEMASIAPTNSLAVQLFDRFPMGAILALVTVSHNVGGAFGSWLPGLLFDHTGSYYSVLALSVIMLFAGALVALKTPDTRRG